MTSFAGVRKTVFLLILVSCTASSVIYPAGSENYPPFVLTAEEGNSKALNDYRLSGDIVPNSYSVYLTPNLEDWTFEGMVIIFLQATVPNVREITLHANDLEIVDIEVRHWTFAGNLANEYSYDNVTHKLTIPLKAEMEDTVYTLTINYLGYMRDDMAGLYRSTYIENGVEKRMAATQAQTVSARRIFPCFDEPKYKAKIGLRVTRPVDYTVLANMKRTTTITVEFGKLYHDMFQVTPLMSTYLFAIFVSEYKPRQDADDKFGIWARPEMYEQTEYAFELGLNLLEYYNNYTDYNYYKVMEKMYLVALPDFASGAMENWGLLTFKESLLLYNENKTSTMAKQRIGAIIAHEQAHMWFGDLVR